MTTLHDLRLPDTWERVLRAVSESHTTTIRDLAAHVGLPPAAVRNIVLALERRGLLARAEGVYDPAGHHDRLVIYATRAGRRWVRRHPVQRQLLLAA